MNINSGSGQVTIGGATNVSGDILLTSSNTANAISGDISGSTAITYVGTANTGHLTLSGNNSQTGTITVTSGTMNANSANAFGTGAVSVGSSGKIDLQYSGTVALGSTLNIDSGGSITNTVNTSSLSVAGISTLAGNITTAGNQLYSGAMTLSGGDRTLQGNAITANGITGSTNGLTIFASAVFNGSVTQVGNLYVSGTTNLGADISTSGYQSFEGAVTLAQSLTTLTTSGTGSSGVVSFSTVNGDTANTQSLAVVAAGGIRFVGIVGGTASLLNLSATGPSIIFENITTGGTQTYTGNVTIAKSSSAAILKSTGTGASGNIQFGSNINGSSNPESLTLNTAGAISIAGAVGNTIPFRTLTITNSGGATFTGLVRTTSSVMLSDTSGVITFSSGVVTSTLTTAAKAYD